MAQGMQVNDFYPWSEVQLTAAHLFSLCYFQIQPAMPQLLHVHIKAFSYEVL